MRYTVLFIAISFLIAGCSKDKFSTVPKLTYESANTTVLQRGDVIEFTMNFTDKEGDLQDSLFIQKVTPKCPADTLQKYFQPLPAFTATGKLEGKIKVVFSYGSVGSFFPIAENTCTGNDTCFFRFMLKDKAQNKSDTVQSEQIVLIK